MATITEQVGRVLGGRYRLEAGIGTGTSAYVYAATDLVLQRRVAVKILHPGLGADEGFLRRFRAEAQAAGALVHPHVLRVLDWGEDADGAFLVLEHLAGGSLRDLLDAGARLDHAQVARIGAEAAHALAYAHRRGLVHRDVKPANLMFDEDGHVRIADFGLARALAEAAWTEPLGAVLGTARYASPEQAEGRSLDDRSDVYSLALVLYEALVGRVPFAADTTIATLMARVGSPLPRAPELGPLAPILAQAAIPEPLARLDAAELAVELELLRRSLAPARVLPLHGTSAPPPAAPPPTNSAPPPASPPRPASPPPAEMAPPRARRHERAGHRPAPPEGSRQQPRAQLFDAEADEALPGVAARAEALQHDGETDAQLDVTGGPGYDAEPDAPDDRAEAAEPDHAGGPDDRAEAGAPATPRRARGRRARLAAVAAALAVVAGGGAVAYRQLVLEGHSVPMLTGDPAASARTVAADHGLGFQVSGRVYSSSVPAGGVVSQRPRAGARVGGGTVLAVELSLGHAPVAVPALATGSGGRDAVARLHALGFPVRLRRAFDDGTPAGRLLRLQPSSGSLPYGSRVVVVLSRGPAPRTIPSIPPGAGFVATRTTLDALGLRPSERLAYSATFAAGEVLSVSPPPGTKGVRKGAGVVVVVSRGPAPVTVPPLAGATSFAAESQALAALGLHAVEQQAFSDTVAYGAVISLSPASGTPDVPVGSSIDVTVSRGPLLVAIPPVAGDSIAQAVAAIEAQGLAVSEQIGPPFATKATTTAPAPGTDVRPGTSVTLYVA